MIRLLFLLVMSFITISHVYAGGEGDMVVGDAGTVVYSEDGTHSGSVTCGSDGCSFALDGVKKATYLYMDYPIVSENDFYVTASDNQKKYLLKNGLLLATADTISFLYGYYNSSDGSKLEGWFFVDGGKYFLYKNDATLLFQSDNAGTSSSSYYIADKVLQTTVYNRNNTTSKTYINGKLIQTDSNGYIQNYGIMKNGKTATSLLLSTTDNMGLMNLMVYNIQTGDIKLLPSYDGITQVAPVYNKNGSIKDFQYIVTMGSGYAFADRNGKILSEQYFDAINTFTTYGDAYLKTYSVDEKMYLHFNGVTYGPFDYIDNFSPSYGNSTNYTKVVRWSVFVKKDGKNYILVSGKQVLVD